MLFVFLCQPIVPDDKARVLLGSQFAVSANAHILFLFVLAELGDSTLHLLQALIELFDLICVALLSLVAVGQVTVDIVLIELH